MNIAVPPRTTRAAEGLARRRFTVAEVTASQMLTPLFPPKELALRLGALKLV